MCVGVGMRVNVGVGLGVSTGMGMGKVMVAGGYGACVLWKTRGYVGGNGGGIGGNRAIYSAAVNRGISGVVCRVRQMRWIRGWGVLGWVDGAWNGVCVG